MRESFQKLLIGLHIVGILLCVYTMSSCRTPSQGFIDNEREKIEDCRRNWVFKNLDTVLEIQVDLFQKRNRFHMMAFPNFIIGHLKDGTYIGILDKSFEKRVRTRSLLTVMPARWSELDKEALKPQLIINKNKLDNTLYCKLKVVLYGQIKQQE